ncbi:DUF5818 domain-containing protein [Sphingomonas sp.]|uniref:DUF5818 domain-containing protein n=1 Tax=Sphingomonas sp. TaxID=28214 RepID=UPI0031D26838
MPIPASIDPLPPGPDTLTGRLVRQAGAFVLQCDDGRVIELRMPRVPVDHVGKSVLLTGRPLGETLWEAEGIRSF